MSTKVKLWGVRGSIPSPHAPSQIKDRIVKHLTQYDAFKESGKGDIQAYLDSTPEHSLTGFGGNTACFEVSKNNKSIIIDGGSGIRRLGEKLVTGPCGKGQGVVDIFFTHFHWDHVIGLPFFIPIFIPGNIINIYSVQDYAEDMFKRVFKKPNFPVPYERIGATLNFHTLEPRKPITVNDMSLTPYQLDHPDPCWGYRVESDGKSYSHCVDTECTRVSREELGEDLPLYQNVDLMVFDAQYTFLEAAEKVDWGHASAPVGLDLAIREGVKKILFIHHDPSANDDKIQLAKEQTKQYYEARFAQTGKDKNNTIEWDFAREEMEIIL